MNTYFKLFLTIWIVYAIYVTPAGGVTPNRYVDLVHSIVNEGTFAIDTYHANTIDKAYFNGHYYAGALPGPSLIAVPFYIVFKGLYTFVPQSIKELVGGVQSFKKEAQANTTFYGKVDNVEYFLSQAFLHVTVVAVISALASVLLFGSIKLLGYSDRIALLTSLLYAFGTIVFFYSTLFFEQIFSAGVTIAVFYLVLRLSITPMESRKPGNLLLIGLTVGSGFLIEYTMVFVVLWMAVWLWFIGTRRGLMFYMLGIAPWILIHMGYSWILFGNPWTTPYAYLISVHETVHGVGFFGATYPRLDRLFQLLAAPERGLFLYMPIAIVAFIGLADQVLRRKTHRLPAAIILAITLFYLIFFSAYTNWRGGSAFGPRYLIAFIPLLGIGVAFAFEILSVRVIYIVGGVSVLINWAGAQFGFANSVVQHLESLVIRGPTLPSLNAILAHSTTENTLFVVVSRYHVWITLMITLALVAIFSWLWRDIWSQPVREA